MATCFIFVYVFVVSYRLQDRSVLEGGPLQVHLLPCRPESNQGFTLRLLRHQGSVLSSHQPYLLASSPISPWFMCLFCLFVFLVQVTDFFMAGNFCAEAINGPTTQNGLPPFVWDKFSSISHQGLPQFYNFSFVRMQPHLFKPWGRQTALCLLADNNEWYNLSIFFILSVDLNVYIASCWQMLKSSTFVSIRASFHWTKCTALICQSHFGSVLSCVYESGCVGWFTGVYLNASAICALNTKSTSAIF